MFALCAMSKKSPFNSVGELPSKTEFLKVYKTFSGPEHGHYIQSSGLAHTHGG